MSLVDEILKTVKMYHIMNFQGVQKAFICWFKRGTLQKLLRLRPHTMTAVALEFDANGAR